MDTSEEMMRRGFTRSGKERESDASVELVVGSLAHRVNPRATTLTTTLVGLLPWMSTPVESAIWNPKSGLGGRRYPMAVNRCICGIQFATSFGLEFHLFLALREGTYGERHSWDTSKSP